MLYYVLWYTIIYRRVTALYYHIPPYTCTGIYYLYIQVHTFDKTLYFYIPVYSNMGFLILPYTIEWLPWYMHGMYRTDSESESISIRHFWDRSYHHGDSGYK